MEADASESEGSMPQTSPRHSDAGDTADEFGYSGDVADSKATPVMEPEQAEQPEHPRDPFKCEPCDARVPTMLPSPIKPSKEDVETHYATHLPYRNWCPVCVKAKGKESPHWRSKNTEKPGLPIVSMDYNELDDEKGYRSNKTLVVKDENSGAVLHYKIKTKGAGDEWVVKKVARDIEELGRTNIRLKTDGEPAIVALQAKVQSARTATTIPLNPPAYSPQSNGACEKAVQDVTAQMRALMIGLESRLQTTLSEDDKIIEWMYPHAAFLVTRYSLGHDGMVAWERLTGAKWHRPIIEFGEAVLAKLATRRVGKGRQKRQQKKLRGRCIAAIWVGQVSRTGEHIVIGPNGDAVRCRTVFRRPQEERWNKELIKAVQGTPRLPAPSQKDPENITSKLVDDQPRAQHARAHREAQQDPTGRERSGADIPMPEDRGPRPFDTRRFRITERILNKYGYTDDCRGCKAKQEGQESGDRAHSDACRHRLVERMAADEEDVHVIEKDAEKLEKRVTGGEPAADKEEADTDAKGPHNEPNEVPA